MTVPEDPEPDIIMALSIILMAFLSITCFIFALAGSAAKSVNEKKLREKAEDGDKRLIRLVKILDTPNRTERTVIAYTWLSGMASLALTLLCFVGKLGNVYLTFLSSEIVAVYFSAATLTLIVTILFTALCVMLPKTLGRQHAEKTAPALSGYLAFFKAIMTPFTAICHGIARLIAAVFGSETHDDSTNVTEDEILVLVDQGEEKGVIEESQKEMINNIFEFDDLAAGDVMTHRTSVKAVEITEPLSSVVGLAMEEGYSRIPVYEDVLDNIKGILYVKDLLKFIGTDMPENITAADVMREAMFVPETKKCRDLFTEMTENRLQMVVVSDEYGGVAGIVTIEDLIESIMGNIQDEFDDETEDVEQISEHIFNIDGTTLIGEVEDLLDIEFPEGDFETIAGYIMSELGRIPDPEEHPTVEYEDFALTVSEMEDRRIVRIMAERLPEPNETETEE